MNCLEFMELLEDFNLVPRHVQALQPMHPTLCLYSPVSVMPRDRCSFCAALA